MKYYSLIGKAPFCVWVLIYLLVYQVATESAKKLSSSSLVEKIARYI